MDDSKQIEEALRRPAISIGEFIANSAPGAYTKVDLPGKPRLAGHALWEYSLPDARMHCADCDGERNFAGHGNLPYNSDAENPTPRDVFVRYMCRDCRRTWKTYGLSFLYPHDKHQPADGAIGLLYKVGEKPVARPPVPAKLLKLVGSEREYFFKGRSAERQGMGIAAFAYYRRVIDERRVQIFDEIIKACRTLQASDALIAELEVAKSAPQFTDAIRAVHKALPSALFIDGHNPLTLLYSALSDGLHNRSDETCLQLAGSIRLVMGELVQRMADIVAENKELKSAVQQLLQITKPETGASSV